MAVNPTFVFKIGGSLFRSKDMVWQFESCISRLTDPEFLNRRTLEPYLPPNIHVIVGGGEMVDCLRNWDQRFRIGEEDCHHLALRAMGVTARTFSRCTGTPIRPDQEPSLKIPGSAQLTQTLSELKSFDGPKRSQIPVVVINLGEFLLAADDLVKEIPKNWEVSSDSLALWYAKQIRADHFVLGKSMAPLDERIDLDKMTRLGWIDGFFRSFWEQSPPNFDLSVVHMTTAEFPVTRVDS